MEHEVRMRMRFSFLSLLFLVHFQCYKMLKDVFKVEVNSEEYGIQLCYALLMYRHGSGRTGMCFDLLYI